MSTKIGLIGDPHATPEPLAEALALFRREGVDAIWCTGDVAGYGEQLGETAALLKESRCRVIRGNHEERYLEKADLQRESSTTVYLQGLPQVIHQEIEGARLCLVHASPPRSLTEGIRLLDENGLILEEEKGRWTERLETVDLDVLIVGHTHQVFAERLGHTLVINPGSTRFNHCCAVLHLPALSVEWFSLSGQMIRRSWNWGNEVRQ